MATPIVDRTVSNVQSPLLDRLSARPGRWRQHHQYDVVQHRAGSATVVRVVPYRVPNWTDAALVRKHEFEDGSSTLLWRTNFRTPPGRLVLAGEGFEFTAERTGNGWRLTLPPEVPADVAALLQ